MHSIGITTAALLTGFVIGIVLGSGRHEEGVDVKLEKLQDESGEFKFEFTKDGHVFSGETVQLTRRIYLMIIDNNTIYGFEIDDYETTISPFYTFATTVEWNEDGNGLYYTNTFAHYLDSFGSYGSYLHVYPYMTKWDTENVCFTKNSTEENTFSYVMKAKNNRRTWTGHTELKGENLLMQYIGIYDTWNGICEFTLIVNITANELNSNETFCKATIYKPGDKCYLGPFGIPPGGHLNPKVLTSLIG